jgi:HAD superfamily 5'-nucleotidase-like hydrolase
MNDDALNTPPRERRIFANRTLNLRAIEAVGFDMDYTLVHYHADRWEARAYERAKAYLAGKGLPVGHLEFQSRAFTQGLVVDRLLGNVVKANRFGFVKRAAHGLRALDFEEQRIVYARVLVDLAEPRWEFMNTLFSLSETCLYAQLVELVDEGKLPPGLGYDDVYRLVRESIGHVHVEGELKLEIARDPDRFVVLDAELPLALLDLKHAGKKLLVVTNSEWDYTRAMMSYAFDRFLPDGSWRNLFDVVIAGARKPEFFTGNAPALVLTGDGDLFSPHVGALKTGTVYLGGNARLVEELLGCPGEKILYVGDHVYSDVNVTKNLLRWRTALVLRDLEAELLAIEAFEDDQAELDRLMSEKERLEFTYSQLRLGLQRSEAGYGPPAARSPSQARRLMTELRATLRELDDRISPLSRRAAELFNPSWGPLLRAGNDKSHFARQIERHADVYTSRVANFLFETPFAYLRSPRGTLPHDPA